MAITYWGKVMTESDTNAPFRIRRATPADIGEVAKVHLVSWRTAHRGIASDEVLNRLLTDDFELGWNHVFDNERLINHVGEISSGIVGFVTFGPSRDDDADPKKVAEIVGIYVHPAGWGAGHGKALWRSALTHLQRDGFHELTLWVHSDNSRAHRFYTMAGCNLDEGAARHHEQYGVSLDEVRYRLRI